MKTRRIKKFYEMVYNYNYDIIINSLINDYHWGNVISNEIEEFENSDTPMPIDTDDYIVKFNQWLFKKFKNSRQTFRDDLVVKTPRSWYAKST